jgi:hypothetical protein
MLTQDYNSQRKLQHIAILVPAVAKSCKPTLKETNEKESQQRTMYIKNRRNISKIKAFDSCQTQCKTESLVLQNRLLFIY